MRKVKLGHKPWLLINVLHMATFVSLNGYNIYLIRELTNYGLEKQLDKMLETAFVMLGILVIMLLLDTLGTFLKSAYIEKSLTLMKTRYIQRLMNQDITQLQKEKCNEYRSNLTNDFDRYEDKYLKNLLNIVHMSLQFIMAVIIVSTVSFYLVYVVIGLLVIFIFLTSKTNKPVQKSEAKKSASLQKYTDYVQETLNGFDIIKQHQLMDKRHQQFVEHATKVQKDNYLVDIKSTQVDSFNNFVQTLVLFSLVVGGVLVAKSSELGLGSLIMVVSSFGNVMWPLQQFTPVITQMKGIVKVLDEFDKNLTRPVINRSIQANQFGTLSFNDCHLGYEDEERHILNHVHLDVKENEKVLIVGRSGAGKSTILKTIRQSIKPKEGLVTLDHHDIFEIVPIDYYSLFTTVDQIGFIFNGSVKDNLTLYQPIEDYRIKDSMKSVGLSSLELDEHLRNNGSNVSGGQRARLMLARALCLESEVILCDEIFSSLEHSIAMEIERDILNLKKTIINVSHIIFKEHLHLYDKIYIVENHTVRLSTNLDEVWERMVLSS